MDDLVRTPDAGAPDRVAPRLVLASASPARLATLRAAGLDPTVVVSGVDEDAVAATLAGPTPADLVDALAAAKCAAVVAELAPREPMLVLGCDSLLDLDGRAYGKPADADEARDRWRRMRGRTGVLHTGHCLRLVGAGEDREQRAVASVQVDFADLSDAEVDAYVATGEPLAVAGAFTIDGLGGAYVTAVRGDPHAVVGVSLPLLRGMLREVGIVWHHLRRDPPLSPDPPTP